MRKKNVFLAILTIFCVTATIFMVFPGAVSGVTVPSSNMNAAIMDIQATVNWILGNVSGVIPKLIDLEQKLWSAGDSVKNDTSAINRKLENITRTDAFGGSQYVAPSSFAEIVDIQKPKPFKVSLTIAGAGLDQNDTLVIQYMFGNFTQLTGAIEVGHGITLSTDDVQNFEFVCQQLIIYPSQVTDGFSVIYSLVITYTD